MLSDLAASFIKISARPVTVTSVECSEGASAIVPADCRGLFLCPLSGLAIVRSAAVCLIVPTHYGAWLSPGLEYEVKVADGGSVLAAFVEQTAERNPIDRTSVLRLPPLLRELLGAAVKLPRSSKSPSPREDRLLRLILDELVRAPVPEFLLRLPNDPRLRSIGQLLLAVPQNADSTAVWADGLGVTTQTLGRRFRKQTGLTFTRWRQRARLYHAAELLAAGTPIGAISERCSYASPSAFAAAFRKQLGEPPSNFRRQA